MSTERSSAPRARLTVDPAAVWPLAIALGLALVVLVNAIFVYIAVHGADDVAPSYVEGHR